MPLLTPDTGLLFWMTIAFGIVFLILAKFGFPVITKAVERRRNYITTSLEAARKAEEQLATLNTQAEAILTDARDERNAILNEAQETRKKIIALAREKADNETQQKLKIAEEEIEESRQRAMLEIKEQVADIAVRIAEKVMGEKLRSDAEQQKLIQRLLNEEPAYKS